MKIVVVGGGISGLYVAFKLLQKGHSIMVFEKSGHFGGRVQSVEIVKGHIVETGAGRFNLGHKRLFRLIRELGLHEKVTPVTMNERRFVKEGDTLNDESKDSYDMYVKRILYDELVKSPWRKQFTKDYLTSITLKEFMLMQLKDESVVNNIISAFGYNSEFEIQNAYTSLTIMANDFSDSIQYYYMQGGLSQLTTTLVNEIRRLGGKLYTSTEIVSYQPTKNQLVYKHTDASRSDVVLKDFDKIVFCVTKSVLENFGFVSNDQKLMEHLASVQMAPLNRMFAKFQLPKRGRFFLDFPFRVTTTLPIRYIFPANPETHVGQVSYTDNEFAKYWSTMRLKDVKQELFDYLKKVFPNDKIERPLWVKRYFWKEGVTYWLPNFKVYKNSRKKPYVIAGEIMSPTHSGWIEGALHGAEKAIYAICGQDKL